MSDIKEFKINIKAADFEFERTFKEDEKRVTYKHTTGNKAYLASAKENGLSKQDIQNVENFNIAFTKEFINNVASPLVEKEFKGKGGTKAELIKTVEVSGPIGTKVKNNLTFIARAGEVSDKAIALNGKEIENKEYISTSLNVRNMLDVSKSEVKAIGKEIKSKL